MHDESERIVSEPSVEYQQAKRTKSITFFESMDEMAEARYRHLASLSHEQLLLNLEQQRKRIYHTQLLPNGQWPLLKRTLRIIPLPYAVR